MSEPNETTSGGGFWATTLIVIGLIWMSLTGLCTGLVAVSSILGDPMGFFGAIPALLVIAVICIGPGWLIWRGGKALRGRRQSRTN